MVYQTGPSIFTKRTLLQVFVFFRETRCRHPCEHQPVLTFDSWRRYPGIIAGLYTLVHADSAIRPWPLAIANSISLERFSRHFLQELWAPQIHQDWFGSDCLGREPVVYWPVLNLTLLRWSGRLVDRKCVTTDVYFQLWKRVARHWNTQEFQFRISKLLHSSFSGITMYIYIYIHTHFADYIKS